MPSALPITPFLASFQVDHQRVDGFGQHKRLQDLWIASELPTIRPEPRLWLSAISFRFQHGEPKEREGRKFSCPLQCGSVSRIGPPSSLEFISIQNLVLSTPLLGSDKVIAPPQILLKLLGSIFSENYLYTFAALALFSRRFALTILMRSNLEHHPAAVRGAT
jgi:hypothetical protein